ncbi:keratin, type I cytoskeletal 20-like isoform X1 [Xiphophorus hellerii]|uniref:keratin, type I cytoskeletal 20-like isoform X1 n=1 Tax=Xiphophorus hellerii TaxID=8084 RepID=UPI0013B3D77F|nr:keratin, type I cytoskeletal 20-like isoform X1 [Xiphophorus hellerii]
MSVPVNQQGFSSSSLGGWMLESSCIGPQRHSHSVYGGAGCFGTRISQGPHFNSSCSAGGDWPVFNGGKFTMQNLNDRLARYLEKVRSLENKNRELQINIDEFRVKTTYITKDYANYFSIIRDLKAEITRSCSENQNVLLQIDNSKLAAEDFKLKDEMEMNMRKMVEADVFRLRGIRDGMTLTMSSLELTVEELKEELIRMKSEHKKVRSTGRQTKERLERRTWGINEAFVLLLQEMEELRRRGAGKVKVDVDNSGSCDLERVLAEMRERYEIVIKNNKQEIEKWYQEKIKALQEQIRIYTTEVETHRSQTSVLKRSYQSLEITRQALYTEIQCWQQNICVVNNQTSAQLSCHQSAVAALEAELQKMKTRVTEHRIKHDTVLEIKARLESEIAEYRRLLEGEGYEQKKALIIKQVTEEVEEQKPHIEKRVKTIVEEIVNGQVVSSSVDTQVHTVQ